MDTKYLPAEREDTDKVLLQKGTIETSKFLDQVLSNTPFKFIILNDKRQIVYSNYGLIHELGVSDQSALVGLRPGEILSCVNSELEPGGCGTAENCKYCGLVNTVVESSRTNDLVISECIISSMQDRREVALNFEVSSKPFSWGNDNFFLVTLQNIAEKKRKEQLERTFFHDITNRTGNVSMFLDLIEKKYLPEGDDKMFKMVKQGLTDLMDDIVYQKKLQQAENGELEVKIESINIEKVIKNISDEYVSLANTYKVQISHSFEGEEMNYSTDKVLLKRILGNLVKNAIEASTSGDIIHISFKTENSDLCFSVSNPAFIPKDIQAQLFNRSFSTKGQGRGIGTYSIRLFTEQFLKGKVELHSTSESGTTFTIRIPVNA